MKTCTINSGIVWVEKRQLGLANGIPWQPSTNHFLHCPSLRPKPVSILPPLIFFSVRGSSQFVFFCVGAHGWVALLCRPWWPYFNLGGGCQTWKPLETPGTQPPFSNAVVNGVEIKSTQSTCKTFYPEAVVLFKY